jgi:hypothetical protein
MDHVYVLDASYRQGSKIEMEMQVAQKERDQALEKAR